MKYKSLTFVKKEYDIVDLISKENLDRLNFLLKAIDEPTHNRKSHPVKVNLPENVENKFYKDLAESNRGLEKESY
ncbi:MAG: hypothetical protein M1365_12595 [Actinobacteria bacterium]|nr:hypothetical protein [Actinomycetota bacterium]